MHLIGRFDKSGRHRRRHIKHMDPFRFQADLFQNFFSPTDPAFGIGITYQVMAVAGQSTRDHDAVDALLDSLQD
jgi:hypothetical protein